MTLEHKDMSEQEELLSDIGGVHDIANDNNDNEDPLVKAALAKHNENLKSQDNINNDEQNFEENKLAMDDDINLERNTFIIPPNN